MKKLFNYALLAAALLVGVNVNADDQLSVSTYTELKNAIEQAPTDEVRTITLTQTLSDGSEEIVIKNGQSIILDLGEEHSISANLGYNTRKAIFFVEHGSLEIKGKNSTIESKDNYTADINIIGSKSDVPNYSNLKIDEGVTLLGPAIWAITIPSFNSSHVANSATPATYGINITIEGNVEAKMTGISINGGFSNHEGVNLPTITIAKTGVVKVAPDNYNNDEPNGIYAAGYAKWFIYGTVEGYVGIYAKAGSWVIDGATIHGKGEYVAPVFNGSGSSGAGSAIVYDSAAGYSDHIDVTITGETKVEADHGFAIEECVTKGDEKMTGEDFVIESGTFKGGDDPDAGCLSLTGTLSEDVKVNGTVTGGTYNGDVTNIISNVDGIITPITNPDGTTSYVVATKPEGKEWKTAISPNGEGEYVKLATSSSQTLKDGGKAEYLVQEGTATVTIPEGKTLEVGEIVLDKDAKIIVEKNAKLIVKGDKGIVANAAANIVLKSEENAPAYFLLDFQVTSNKTPKATVNFTANSWAEGSEYQYQYFGAPFVGGAIESIAPVTFTGRTSFVVWTNSGWQSAGKIENGVSTIDYTKFNTQFGFYGMCAVISRETPKVDYVFTGRLFGNTDPEITVNYGYTALSNGFTGKMDGEAIFGALENKVEENVWVPKTDENYELQWEARNGLRKLSEINPMATFMVKNDKPSSAKINLSYEDIVWNPATETKAPAGAPKANNFAMATVRVEGCGLNDIITFAEDNQFSAEFDNGYDAEKYENTSIRFYVNADKEYDIFATDNVNNTFVGLMTTKAGKYTISFEGVTGDFALVDLATNARINMVEGATYEFLAEEGENAHRFMIVAAAKAPTNNEKVPAAVKANKALINNQIVINKGERFFNILGTDVK